MINRKGPSSHGRVPPSLSKIGQTVDIVNVEVTFGNHHSSAGLQPTVQGTVVGNRILGGSSILYQLSPILSLL